MKKATLTTTLTLLAMCSIFGQHSSMSIFANSSFFCSSTITYRVTVTNIDVINDPMPLTGTKVTVRIWKENANPMNDDPVHTAELEGPDIAPGQNHVFEVRIVPGTIDENGSYKALVTFNADLDENDDPTSPEFTFKMSLCGISSQEAQQKIIEYIETNINLGEDQAGYMYPEKIAANSILASYNPEEFQQQIFGSFFLGVVFSNPMHKFEQETKYIVVDGFTAAISEYGANWWPVINGEGWHPFPNDETLITDYTIPEYEGIEFEIDIGETIENPKTCALLISGIDDNDSMQMAFLNDVKNFKNNLIANPFGPRLPESQIIIKNGITKLEIKAEIQKLKKNYDKIYYYYSGHGSKSGKMCTGESADQWYPYDELADDLLVTEAKELNVILDCCYSGKIKESFKAHPNYCNKKIELAPSSHKDSTSASIIWSEPGKDYVGAYSHFFNLCSSDQAADSDSDGVVSVYEAGVWIIADSPRIFGDTYFNQFKATACTNEYDEEYKTSQIVQWINENVPQEKVTESSVYLRNKGGNEIEVQDLDDQQLIKTETGQLLGFGNIKPQNFFPKDIFLFKIQWKDECQEIEGEYQDFKRADLFQLSINDENLSFFEPGELIIEPSSNEILPFDDELTLEEYEVPPPENGRGAMFIRGNVFPYNTDDFDPWNKYVVAKYLNQTRGPSIQENAAQAFIEPRKIDVCEYLESKKNFYDHFYFHYFGHGMGSNGMYLNANKVDNLSYDELFQKLCDLNADSLTIVLDTGLDQEKLVEEIQTSCLSEKRYLMLFTPKGDEQGFLVKGELPEQVVVPRMSNDLLQNVGALETEDLNNDDETDFFEAIRTAKIKNPSMKLGFGVGVSQISESNINSNNPSFFPLFLQQNVGLGFYLISHWGSSPDSVSIATGGKILETNQEFSTTVGSFFFWRSCPSVDFQYNIKRTIADFKSDQGILGLIRRATATDEWEIVAHQVYNPDQEIISVTNQEICGEYRLAKIDGSSSIEEVNGSDIDIRLIPTLVTNNLTFELELETASDLEFNVVSMDGQIVHHIRNKTYASGYHQKMLDMSQLSPGTYLLQIIENSKKSTLKIFVKH